ncbi:CLUMA_CG020832, isoform A [Clunio marinus]|uniref:CLUMA_CG020832, isoform A n=1 Tax=Clunio marinus TaxID=568069 RepID=A0A1J1J6E0_9DIPT|nr:CLUMA_CG020832, isoform A [Clunio marinus]
MSDENDDLLNFEITEVDFADGPLNEDELLLSDEENEKLESEVEIQPPTTTTVKQSSPKLPSPQPSSPPIPQKQEESKEEPNESTTTVVEDKNIKVSQVLHHPHSTNTRQPFRHKFQRWPNHPQRWNSIAPQQQQQQMPFQPQSGPHFRPPPNHVMQAGSGPIRQMRPNFPPRPPFFNNNFMQSRQPLRPPQIRPRYFYPNPAPMNDPQMPRPPSYVPSPVQAMPRKVLINPNFKGGVEAAKSQLMKDQYFSPSALPEDELLRKQQEFINHNMRQIEKRRHERTPSPEYRRGYSHSPSPPRYRDNRRKPFRSYDRKRDFSGSEGKNKDENQPEEDEETRAYRQQIESQRKKREEILRQKEMRRRQQAEKAKETAPSEPLQPIIVTDKKIVLKRKSPERSTTPPLKDAPITPTRRIVLKPSKDGKVELKPILADGSKRKIQKILNS